MARILIIDDDDAVRASIRDFLEIHDHTTVELSDGSQAVSTHKDTPVDLVVTDIFMPGKEGMETIVDLNRSAPNLPIIAISGTKPTSGGDYLSMANRLGAKFVLGKPFSMSELIMCVNACLDGTEN